MTKNNSWEGKSWYAEATKRMYDIYVDEPNSDSMNRYFEFIATQIEKAREEGQRSPCEYEFTEVEVWPQDSSIEEIITGMRKDGWEYVKQYQDGNRTSNGGQAIKLVEFKRLIGQETLYQKGYKVGLQRALEIMPEEASEVIEGVGSHQGVGFNIALRVMKEKLQKELKKGEK